MAGKEEKVEFEGEVVEALSNGKFRIALDNGHETLGYVAGTKFEEEISLLMQANLEQLGFNMKVPAVKLPNLTWNMLSEIPYKVGALVVGRGLIAAFRNRGASESGESKQGKEK